MTSNRNRKLIVSALAALLATALAVAPAFAARARGRSSRVQPATAAITGVAVSGTRITVTGRVQLPRNTASERRRARVLLTLTSAAGVERHTAGLSAKRTYRIAWTTTFTGRLKLSAKLTIAGKQAGRLATRSLTITPASTPPAGGTPLVGIFKLTAGSAPAGQGPTGSYFEMLEGNGAPLGNLSSPAANKDFTPLSPGTAGGLSTEAYQPAPAPAFAGGSSGGALADEIIEPVPFYAINFSAETAATDAQTGGQDPVPSILDDNGQLTGQITAWDAQWNGQSFNQGTPKPNGTVPAPTTPLSGTYDATTHAFTLQWKSLIVGGPFNGFTGYWHLTGTFVPAPSSSGGLLPPIPTKL
jgi:hypothetical protein